jgi:7-cyano-7-deazaguanine synthase in queuosine biosynthesis
MMCRSGGNVRDVILLSGMDSLVGWRYLGEPKAVYCKLGHRYEVKEIVMLSRLAKKIGIDITFDDTLNLKTWELPNAEIPLRNALLAMVASMYGRNVWIVFQKGETQNPSNDRSPEFCEKVSSLLTHMHGKTISVNTPFWDMTKAQMVRWYTNSGYDVVELLEAPGCFGPPSDTDIRGYCNSCGACFRKFVAFEYNGIDTSDYFPNILLWDGVKKYAVRSQSGHYEKERAVEILSVLKQKGVV